jgi:hypothetical protein
MRPSVAEHREHATTVRRQARHDAVNAVFVGSVEFPDQFFSNRAAIVFGCHVWFSPSQDFSIQAEGLRRR